MPDEDEKDLAAIPASDSVPPDAPTVVTEFPQHLIDALAQKASQVSNPANASAVNLPAPPPAVNLPAPPPAVNLPASPAVNLPAPPAVNLPARPVPPKPEAVAPKGEATVTVEVPVQVDPPITTEVVAATVEIPAAPVGPRAVRPLSDADLPHDTHPIPRDADVRSEAAAPGSESRSTQAAQFRSPLSTVTEGATPAFGSPSFEHEVDMTDDEIQLEPYESPGTIDDLSTLDEGASDRGTPEPESPAEASSAPFSYHRPAYGKSGAVWAEPPPPAILMDQPSSALGWAIGGIIVGILLFALLVWIIYVLVRHFI